MRETRGRSVVSGHEAAKPVESCPQIRTLKIEAHGDFYKGLVKPKIRLGGDWLRRAGFTPGSHVSVACVAPGVIELRSSDVLRENKKR